MRCPWPARSEPPELTDGCFHVWYLPLDVNAQKLADLFEFLSDDERERAERYRFEHVRDRFVACRGQMRQVLGKYLSASPKEIDFQYAIYGKPSLDRRWDSNLEFNVSNSGDAALLALARSRVLGVDIEKVRDVSNVSGLIGRFFAPTEQKSLASMVGDALLDGFFRTWTSKEAILKATSMGLSIAPEKVEVQVVGDVQANVLKVDDERSTFETWWLHRLDVGEGYIAALASPGEPAVVEAWTWADG